MMTIGWVNRCVPPFLRTSPGPGGKTVDSVAF
jgi:hypothetical protein